MSLKKLFTIIVTLITSTFIITAIAGGPDIDDIPPSFDGLFFEVNIGYAHVDWRHYGLGITNFTSVASPTSNTVGGISFGAVGGYQFDEFWSLEGGWYYLPRVSGTTNNVSAIARGWFTYGALKLSMPVHPDIYVFGKFGAAVRYTRLSARAALNHTLTGQVLPISAHYWAPVFAVGMQYYLSWNWSINVQYLRLPGYQRLVSAASTNRLNVPAVNLITAGLSVKFAV